MKTQSMSLANLRMPKVGPLAATLTLVLFAGLAPATARAQSCHNELQGHVTWAINKPDGPGDYYLAVAMVSNQLGLNATFAEGALRHKVTFFGDVFSGPAKQYFSKRRWGTGFEPEKYPFNVNQADNVQISLNADLSRATLTLANATYNFDLECDHLGVLHGVGNPQGFFNLATPMFVFSVKRVMIPEIS
jgi:hypothetical protein